MNQTARSALGIIVPAGAFVAMVAFRSSRVGQWFSTDGTSQFRDLEQITYSADCESPTAGVPGDVTCDLYGRPYNYPPLWVDAADVVGVERGDTYTIGVALFLIVAVAVAVLGYLSARGGLLAIALLTLAAVSSPMYLLVARANTDIVVMALLSAALAYLLLSRSRAAMYALAAVVTATAGIKIFPVGGLLAWIGRWRIFAVTSAVTLALIAATSGRYLSTIRDSTPAPSDFSFGSGVIIASLTGGGEVDASDMLLGSGLLVLAVVGLLAVPAAWRMIEAWTEGLVSDRVNTTAFLAVIGIYGSTYLLTTSYEYRLWILLPVLVVGIPLTRSNRSRLLGYGLSLGTVLVLHVSHPIVVFVYTVILAVTAIPLAAQIFLGDRLRHPSRTGA